MSYRLRSKASNKVDVASKAFEIGTIGKNRRAPQMPKIFGMMKGSFRINNKSKLLDDTGGIKSSRVFSIVKNIYISFESIVYSEGIVSSEGSDSPEGSVSWEGIVSPEGSVS